MKKEGSILYVYKSVHKSTNIYYVFVILIKKYLLI